MIIMSEKENKENAREEVKQNAKSKWDMKNLIHLQFRIRNGSSDGRVTTRLPRAQQ